MNGGDQQSLVADAEVLERAAEVLRRHHAPHAIHEPDMQQVADGSFGYIARTEALGVLLSDARAFRSRAANRGGSV